MDKAIFDAQYGRLTSAFGARYKSEEFKKELWLAIGKYPDEFMLDTTRYFINYAKGTPLKSEWDTELFKWDRGVAERRAQAAAAASFGGAGPLGMMRASAKAYYASAQNEDSKQFVKKCVEVVSDFTARKITRRQFDEACDMLDKIGNILTHTKATKEPNCG